MKHHTLNNAKEEDMKERAFICLIAREPNEAPLAFAVCASDATSAMERGRQGAAAEGLDLAAVIGILTQEDVTRMGMLLAAARACLSPAPTMAL